MRSKGNIWVGVVCLASLMLLASCHRERVHRAPSPGPGVGYGPPPHAKAHGYRNKQVCGYELVYDSDHGVYVVVGVTDCYYHEGHFYRLRGGAWEISLRADTWEPANHDRLPPGLQIKTKSVAKLNGNDPVKVNGNGNAPVKLNGNSGGNGKGKSFVKGRK